MRHTRKEGRYEQRCQDKSRVMKIKPRCSDLQTYGPHCSADAQAPHSPLARHMGAARASPPGDLRLQRGGGEVRTGAGGRVPSPMLGPPTSLPEPASRSSASTPAQVAVADRSSWRSETKAGPQSSRSGAPPLHTVPEFGAGGRHIPRVWLTSGLSPLAADACGHHHVDGAIALQSETVRGSSWHDDDARNACENLG